MFNSIKNKLLLSHFLIYSCLIIIGVGSIMVIRMDRVRFEERRLAMVAGHSGDMVDQKLHALLPDLTRLAQSTVVSQYVSKYQERMLVRYFTENMQDFNEISFVAVDGFEEVRVINGTESDELRQLGSYAFLEKSRELPNQALLDSELYVTPDGPCVRLCYGIKSYFGGRYEGAIIASYPLKKLRNILAMMGPGQGLMVSLVGADGRLLAGSTGAGPGSLAFDGSPRGEERLRDLKNGRGFSGRNRLFGEDVFCVSAPVRGQQWSVIAHLPYQEFSGLVAKIKGLYLVIMLITGIIGWLMVYLISKHLTAPLVDLAEQASRVADGHACTLDVKSTDEVGSLVVSFNRMINELRETTVSREYLNQIIDNMNDFLMVTDEVGLLKRVNRKVLEELGVTAAEMTGRHFGDLIVGYPPDNPPLAEALPRLLAGETIELEMRGGGRSLSVLLSSSVLLDHEDRPAAVVLVAHDISERKLSEEKLAAYAEQLEESNRELEEFAYVASHDLKEPLRKITGFGERLKMKFADQLGEQGQDYLARMESAAARMQRLIDDLLTYSRVKTKARPFEPVDLSEVLAGVLSDLETRLEETGGKVEVSGLTSIDADPMQMRQLFQNLIGNGLKFHRPGVPPEVKISGEVTGDTYRLLFSDNGIGFEEKYRDKIFGVFQRLHGRGAYEGSGIGLSVCRKIAKRHGGDIDAAGLPGQGATFTVTLSLRHPQEGDGEGRGSSG